MLSVLPAPLRGVLAGLALALNTLFWCWPLFALSLLKLALPFPRIQRVLRFGMHWVAESWMAGNGRWMDSVRRTRWDVQGLDKVDMRHSYLVTSNHQSWVDILVLQYLLKPRAGGIAFVIDAMGEQLTSLINITIHYPGGNPSFWDLLCGRIGQVVMRIDSQPIPAEFLHRSYDQDEGYRLAFQEWVNQLWSEKDALLETLHRQYPPAR